MGVCHIDQKLYVSKCVYFNYPALSKGLNCKLISNTKEPNEKASQYFLVLAGFFWETVPQQFFHNDYKSFISKGFRKNPKLRDLSFNVPAWIDILREIHRKKWFGKPDQV